MLSIPDLTHLTLWWSILPTASEQFAYHEGGGRQMSSSERLATLGESGGVWLDSWVAICTVMTAAAVGHTQRCWVFHLIGAASFLWTSARSCLWTGDESRNYKLFCLSVTIGHCLQVLDFAVALFSLSSSPLGGLGCVVISAHSRLISWTKTPILLDCCRCVIATFKRICETVRSACIYRVCHSWVSSSFACWHIPQL